VTNRRSVGCLIEIVQTLVLTLVLFWVVQSFIAQPFRVKQVSMEQTILSDQYVLVDKLTPRFDPYNRGDIVVFDPPNGNPEGPAGDPFIKRIIAIAGDTIELRGGGVVVNGVELDEPYLYAVDGVRQPTEPESDETSWTIGPGHVFVMGDHRSRSSDSRAFGPILIEDVVGRAWLRYWPLSAFGVLPAATHPEVPDRSPTPSSGPTPSATSTPRSSATP
jgi:signal peptidase I